MVHLDADGVAGTTNSSASQLDLPPGATVLWAGLYWGARLQAGTGGQAGNANAIDRVSLRAPGDAAYRTVTASQAARDQFGPNPGSYNAYQRFSDITAIVRAAGNGTYWGANVAAATGRDRYAGWAMTVVYSAPGLPLRNLTVFDGFDVVQQGRPQSVTVAGFLAPRSGTVDAQLTMLVYEGDLSQTGDYTRLNSTQLATPLSPGSNFFDSSNDVSGTSVATRTPAHRNMLGVDIKNLGASGAIRNSATSATFTFSSNGDVYYPGVVGLAINLYAPDFSASSKSVVNTSGNTPARPGDVLQYTLGYANTGQDAAVDVVSEDVLPPGTTYVPGSLALVDPATGATTALSDDAGDDRGEVDGRTVRVRLGGGAGASAGGRMACSGSGCTGDGTSRQGYTFRVRLDAAGGGTTVVNTATLDYATETTGTEATYTTNPAATEVAQQADVSIAKVMTPDPAPVGSAVTATLTVRNDGPNTATGVTVADTPPAGWEGVTASTTQGSCAVTDGTVGCSLGDLADGATATVTLTGTTAAGSTATALTNVASVSTTAVDPAPANNVSGDTVVLTREADLVVAKTVAPGTYRAGEPVRRVVTVTNQGPSDAQGVIVDDVVDDPALATLTGISGADCALRSAAAVRCTLPRLAAGAAATITVDGVLATGLGPQATVGNTASAAAATPDPAPLDNTARASLTTAEPAADVRVTKTGPASVVAGSSITWTVTATNWGPSDAAEVTVADSAPPGVTFTGASTSRGTCTTTAGAVSCPVGTLPAAGPGPDGALRPGADATITLTGTVAPDATGALSNTATATAATADPLEGDNAATASTQVTAEYDLAVSKTANRSALPGQDPPDTRPVRYVVTVTNNGPSTATGVVLRDLVPTALRLDAVTVVAPAEGTCSEREPTAEPAQALVTCELTSPLPPGESRTVEVDMTATTNLAAIGEPVTQTVTVDAPGDTTPDNDTATWVLSGDPSSDLSLTKTADAQVTAGGTAEYDLVVTNNVVDPDEPENNYTALRPVVTDTLPPGVTYVSASGDGACTAAGRELTCRLDADLAVGASAALTVTVAVDPALADGTTLVNAASVRSANPETNPDDNPANNTAEATSVVRALADVAVTALTVDPLDDAWTGPGTQRAVHLSLRNEGPSTARAVTFRLTRAVDAFVVDPGTQPPDCVNTGREVECTVGDLAPGQTVDVDYVIEVSPDAQPGSYPETVVASTATAESTLDNNERDAEIVVGTAVTDLEVTKTPLGTVPNPYEAQDPHPAFVAGGAFGYRIEVRVPAAPDDAPAGAGYASARDVVLDDLLPPGFVARSVTVTGGALCALSPVVGPEGVRSSLSCDLGTVPGLAGTAAPPSAVVTVTGTLHPDANDLNGGDVYAEQVLNTAVVTSGTALVGDRPDARGTASVDVVETADLTVVKTPDAGTVTAGGSIGYTLTVLNAGPSGVEHAVVSDRLPVGFTLDRARSDCEPPRVTGGVDETQAQPVVPDGPGEEFRCRLGEVDARGQASVHVVATTDPTLAPGTYTNTATVGLLANEADPTDNTTTADVTVARLTNLAISSSVSTTTPAAGQDVTFTAFSVNNGPSTAVGTTADTTFPPGFVPVSVDVPLNDCTWNRQPPADPRSVPWEDFRYVLHCEPATPGAQWEPGGSATNVVVMHVPGDTPGGEYSGESVIRSQTPETTLEDNTTGQTVLVQHVSDMRVTKELVEPDPMVAGAPATWRLTVTNDGPSVAESVVVSDNVPDGMTFVAAGVEGGQACPPPEPHTTTAGDTETIVRCPVGTLGVGQSASVLVTFTVGAGQVGDELCNDAVVGSGSLDPDAADNEAQVCAVATGLADVSLTLTPESQTRASGERAELTATVRNEGPSTASDVVATLELPPGFTDYSGEAVAWPDGRPQPPDGVVGSLTFAVGDLAPGEQVEYRVVGTVSGAPGDVLPVEGVETQAGDDPVPANDADTAQVLLVAGPPPTPAPSPTTPSTEPPPSTDPPPAAAGDDPSDRGRARRLPVTGTDPGLALLAALTAVAAGAALLGLRRRRSG
ncbi:DUF11 domain-containing protein [Cellulomonas telluris]|uniref:DUF11 domain-containing protein n=1 Tax=Cellulomonas telluris TaxID=2306636 RepID=UPI0010A89E6D|nr:DUF11 domain-containing protein [Cellulomonas telluris]